MFKSSSSRVERVSRGKHLGFFVSSVSDDEKSFITLKLGDPELEKVSTFWDYF
jgi:hypothetical protein